MDVPYYLLRTRTDGGTHSDGGRAPIVATMHVETDNADVQNPFVEIPNFFPYAPRRPTRDLYRMRVRGGAAR